METGPGKDLSLEHHDGSETALQRIEPYRHDWTLRPIQHHAEQKTVEPMSMGISTEQLKWQEPPR